MRRLYALLHESLSRGPVFRYVRSTPRRSPLAAVMGWAPSTAVAMSMRYGHLFAARDEHLTEALERVYRSARRPNDGQQATKLLKRSEETGA
jgi:hypothetical protein